MRRLSRIIITCLLMLTGLTVGPLAAPETALALDTTVDLCDWETFSATLDAVQDSGGGTLVLGCSDVIDFEEEKTITTDVTLIGHGDVIFDGGEATRFFGVVEGARLTLVNLTLRNGNASGGENGGAIASDGDLEVVGGSFTGNSASATGGGGAIVSGGTLTVRASSFSDNSAESGGAIAVSNGTANVSDSSFSENSASNGGGAINTNPDATLSVTGSAFSDNHADIVGGAMDLEGTVTVTASTFSGNSSVDGGAIRSSATLTVTSSAFNTTLSNTDSGNRADVNGGAIASDGVVNISASTFSENSAGQSGGAVRSTNMLEVRTSTFSENSASQGGAILLTNTGTVTSSTFADNSARSQGGAIRSDDNLVVTASTFAGNTTRWGGAIHTFGMLDIKASTFSGNVATIGGAIDRFSLDDIVTISASILVDNPARSSEGGGNCSIPMASAGYNLSDDESCGFESTGDEQGEDVDVELGALADNGGPTKTMLPGEDSDAIDAAACSVSSDFDQRGVDRPAFGSMDCDIGSVEIGDVPDDPEPTTEPVEIFITYNLGPTVEGQPVEIAVVAFGPDGAPLTYEFDCDDDEVYEISQEGDPSAECVFDAEGDHTALVRVSDGTTSDSGATGVEVLASAPVITALTLDPSSSDEGDEVILTADFTHDEPGATHTCEIDWGEGAFENGTLEETNGGLRCTGTHTYADDDEYDVAVVICDDDGDCDDSATTQTVNNVVPSVDAGADQSVDEGDLVSLDPATFSDPGTVDTHFCSIDWGDDDEEAGDLDQDADTCAGSHTYADNGTYEVEVCVFDDDAEACDTLSVTVNNVAPSVEQPVVEPSPSDEGGAVNVSAAFTDPGVGELYDCTVNWGDGTVEASEVEEHDGNWSCVADHTYVDDDEYTVTVEVCDSDEACDSASTPQTVDNVLPSVDAGDNQSVVEGDLVNLAPAVFSDPGTADTHDCTIDWEDGPEEPGTVDQENDTCAGSHTYVDDGSFTVEVCVTDDDGEACDSLSVTVTNAAPVVESMQINPSPSDEARSVELSAAFTDPGTLDTHGCAIDWGDGAAEAGDSTEQNGSGSCSGSHTYADDGDYTVTVEVCEVEDAGSCGLKSTTQAVIDVAPVVETLQLNPDSPDEGSLVTVNATFSDPGTADEHTCQISWGDGTSAAGAVDQTNRTCVGGHPYLDDGDFTITVEVCDIRNLTSCDSSSAIQVVNNVPPEIEEIVTNSPVPQGQPVTITVQASDPAGVNDPLRYRFDCDNDGNYDIGPQASNETDCQLDPALYVTTITVEVDDGDGGVVTGSVAVQQTATVCANPVSGAVSGPSMSGACPAGTFLLTLPGPFSTTFCVSAYTGTITWSPAGGCGFGDRAHSIPDDGPLNYCQHVHTNALRFISHGQCNAYEWSGVIPG